jgi:ribosomal protein S18 acetylase RimI-like enzyme
MTQIQTLPLLASSQEKTATRVLARAFHTDPMMEYVVPDTNKRPQPLSAFFDICIRYARSQGEIYTTPETQGAALWIAPGMSNLSLGGALKAGLLPSVVKGATSLGLGGFRRLLKVGNYTQQAHHRLVPGPHWYLLILGVDPAQQGKGIGGALMRPVLAKADAAGLPCYLETMKEKNLAIYHKYGFNVVEEGAMPKGGLYVWFMVREPQS